MASSRACSFFFFFNDTATTEIYTLSLHDALPIYRLRERVVERVEEHEGGDDPSRLGGIEPGGDRKSTRLNSSHGYISYSVFCLEKKKFFRRTATNPWFESYL